VPPKAPLNRGAPCHGIIGILVNPALSLSVSSGQFHPTLKQSTISPLLKKSNLDKDQLSNYRPISNLSLVSKIIERVVNLDLLNILLPIISLIPTSLLTLSITTPLKLLCCTFMIILLML